MQIFNLFQHRGFHQIFVFFGFHVATKHLNRDIAALVFRIVNLFGIVVDIGNIQISLGKSEESVVELNHVFR